MWRSTSFRRKIRSLRQKFTGGLLTRYFRKRSNSRLFLILFCQNRNFLTCRFLTARYWRRQWCLLCLTLTDLPGMMRLARWGGGGQMFCVFIFEKESMCDLLLLVGQFKVKHMEVLVSLCRIWCVSWLRWGSACATLTSPTGRRTGRRSSLSRAVGRWRYKYMSH